MVDLVQQYDPEAESSDFDQLPDGTYEAQIIESEKEPISKDKDIGDCLSLTWQVTKGDCEKRLFWQRISLWWDGPEKTPGKVREIANQQFAGLRKATGVAVPNNTEELHYIPCLVTLGRQKTDPKYQEVKAVKPAGSVPDKQVAGQQSAAPATANGGRAPWPRKTA